MTALRIATLIVAPLFISGCFSAPKEKTEFEKEIDAVPMPTTEAERLEQCRGFGQSAANQWAHDLLQNYGKSWSDMGDYHETLALERRLKAMKCVKDERTPRYTKASQ